MDRIGKDESSTFFKGVFRLVHFFQLIGVRLHYFSFAIVLAFIAVLINLLVIRLLIALLRGIIGQDFEFTGHLPSFKPLIAALPYELNQSALFFLIVGCIFFS